MPQIPKNGNIFFDSTKIVLWEGQQSDFIHQERRVKHSGDVLFVGGYRQIYPPPPLKKNFPQNKGVFLALSKFLIEKKIPTSRKTRGINLTITPDVRNVKTSKKEIFTASVNEHFGPTRLLERVGVRPLRYFSQKDILNI